MHPLGQNLLLARRLVEAGVGFVTVNGWTGPSPADAGGGPPSSSWDMHGGEMGMGNAFGNGSYGMGWCLPRLDEALSALLIDLRERGMLERHAGRRRRRVRPHAAASTADRPARAGSTGRPATRRSSPAAASAAARSTASPTSIGAYVKDRPVRPQDLGATIYHALGVPLETRLGSDGFTRPVSTGEPLLDLFG